MLKMPTNPKICHSRKGSHCANISHFCKTFFCEKNAQLRHKCCICRNCNINFWNSRHFRHKKRLMAQTLPIEQAECLQPTIGNRLYFHLITPLCQVVVAQCLKRRMLSSCTGSSPLQREFVLSKVWSTHLQEAFGVEVVATNKLLHYGRDLETFDANIGIL